MSKYDLKELIRQKWQEKKDIEVSEETTATDVASVESPLMLKRRPLAEEIKGIDDFNDTNNSDAPEDILEVDREELKEILDELDEKILVYQINGPLFFGIVQDFMKEMKTLDLKTEVLILDIRHAGSIDASAVAAMKEIYRKCKQYNIRFINR